MGHRPLIRTEDPSRQIDDLRRRVENLERRYDLLGIYEIKLFADRGALDGNLPDEAIIVSAGIQKIEIEIPPDLDTSHLIFARAFVSVAGSSDLTVQVRNETQAVDMLTDLITIDAGDLSSRVSASPVVIDTANDQVADGDHITFEVVDAGGGDAEGLGVIVNFG